MSTVNVKIKKLYEDVIIPQKCSLGAAGFDIYAHEDVTVYPCKDVVKVSTGFAVELPVGYEMQIRSRSGLSSKKVCVANSPATIDSDFRGQVMVLLRNDSELPFRVSKGDRIAQALIQEVPEVVFQVVDELDETERGENGFGSTGV